MATRKIRIIKPETTESKIDNQIFEYLQKMQEIKSGQAVIPKPSSLRVSTISAKCRLTGEINIEELNNLLKPRINKYIINQEKPDYLVQGIQYGPEVTGMFKKIGKKLKNIQDKIDKNDKKNVDFYNQCTLLLYSDYNNNIINLKLFCNGSITMTGCKDENDGQYVVNKLIEEFIDHKAVFNYDDDQKDISMDGFKITMINSDYFIGFRIDLIKLEYILSNQYSLFFSYDPKIYAAVKISFLWNENNKVNNGLCTCSKKCVVSTKKQVKRYNKCSIITVAIFNSGKIIITGSNDMKKTRDAYNYINSILRDNYTTVAKFSIHDCIKPKVRSNCLGRPRKSVVIKKDT